MKATRTALRAALLLFALTWASQACGQEPDTTTRTPGMAGEVQCVAGDPQATPPLPSLTGLARAENIRHEAMHVSQYAVGCDSVAHAWETDAAFRLALEAKASCEGLTVYADPLVRRRRKGETVALLTRLYLPAFGFEDVMAALNAWCTS